MKSSDLHRDIVSLRFVKDLQIDGGRPTSSIELTTPACPAKDQMKDQARAAVLQLGASAVDVPMTARVRVAASSEAGRAPR